MAVESANPQEAKRDEWFERIVVYSAVWFRGVRYSSGELIALLYGRRSSRVEVRLDKADASAILVRLPGRKFTLSVPAVSHLEARASKGSPQADPLLSATSRSEKTSRRVCYQPVVLQICRDAIAEVYMTPVRRTIQRTLEVAGHRVHIEQTRINKDHEKNPVEFPIRLALRLPTYYLIRPMIDEIPPFDRHAARYGRRAALMKFRGGCGSFGSGLAKPRSERRHLFSDSSPV